MPILNDPLVPDKIDSSFTGDSSVSSMSTIRRPTDRTLTFSELSIVNLLDSE
jgi:hypothetical protein